MADTPPLEKSGAWMVIVTTDSKGRVFAYPHEGRDHDAAFQKIERQARDSRWLVHWEKGFQTRADAEVRANAIELELESRANTYAKRVN
ncbi:MAG: hypothetical protein ACFE0S_07450 [Rhodospirillales bacterium]